MGVRMGIVIGLRRFMLGRIEEAVTIVEFLFGFRFFFHFPISTRNYRAWMALLVGVLGFLLSLLLLLLSTLAL